MHCGRKGRGGSARAGGEVDEVERSGRTLSPQETLVAVAAGECESV